MKIVETVTLGKPFCVIAPMLQYGKGVSRNWVGTIDEAVRHGGSLLLSNDQKADELYVVQVVRIIRKPQNYEVVAVIE